MIKSHLLNQKKKTAFISPVAIHPYPKATERKKTVSKNKGKAENLTSTPYKEELDLRLKGKQKNNKNASVYVVQYLYSL